MDFICLKCGLNTEETDMNQAVKRHRRIVKGHAPDLITMDEYDRLIQKESKKRR